MIMSGCGWMGEGGGEGVAKPLSCGKKAETRTKSRQSGF